MAASDIGSHMVLGSLDSSTRQLALAGRDALAASGIGSGESVRVVLRPGGVAGGIAAGCSAARLRPPSQCSGSGSGVLRHQLPRTSSYCRPEAHVLVRMDWTSMVASICLAEVENAPGEFNGLKAKSLCAASAVTYARAGDAPPRL